ncbi:ABC transporter permease [Flavobacterium sp. xlx-214]|uniref:ABC transporter permease n=1 Tax=unclassified Flavobacterium TaxID=196869 RepID=UPI0013D2A48B|nr:MULTISPECIES: ABC transporter permease [unclassified Flavobacterium]MBA5792664.1 ABC transporter permease [Flavobacterium sp. xlx-221]QMI83812.1 ABC transporter permease [Flavobacterium sp. xlx-214]
MITKIAWKNTWFKPLNTFLSIVLLTASVAIISILILLQKQFEEKFSASIDNIDLVLGAKGSPLQLILSSVYQMDAPPGNISYTEAEAWMNKPMVESAVPLAYGDNYLGYKIVGTTDNYLKHFNLKVAQGTVFTKDFEVVVGAAIAKNIDLKVGATFYGTHGDAEEGEVHDHHAYKVVGILEPSGKVADQLILSTIESVWHMHDHEHEGHAEEAQNHASEETHHHAEGKAHHDHEEVKNPHEGKEITAVLLKLRNNMAKMTWPRIIPQNTEMQAASPALEVNRLFALFGVGITALKYLAYGIMLISGISIFVALYNTLKERKYEFALLRITGASRFQLLWLVLLESIFLCVMGFILGIVFGRVGLYMLSVSSQEEFKMAFNPFEFLWKEEGLLFAATLAVGIIAALIPAIKAYSLNISKTLANA